MRYDTIQDLPIHCHLNLPEAALHVYRDAWNRTWEQTSDRREARERAWGEVRERFERDSFTGRWIPRAQPMPLHAVEESAPAAASAV